MTAQLTDGRQFDLIRLIDWRIAQRAERSSGYAKLRDKRESAISRYRRAIEVWYKDRTDQNFQAMQQAESDMDFLFSSHFE